MVSDDARNQAIVDDVRDALGRRRDRLVLTRSTAHLEALVAMLAARGYEAMVFRSGVSAAAHRDAKGRLAAAVLAAPISFDGLLVRCAGRVLRASPAKTSPKLTTTTTPPRRRWPSLSPDACPPIARSDSDSPLFRRPHGRSARG